MDAEESGGESHVVEVEFNQQQDVILQYLRETGGYGNEDAEIIRNGFREFLKQTRL